MSYDSSEYLYVYKRIKKALSKVTLHLPASRGLCISRLEHLVNEDLTLSMIIVKISLLRVSHINILSV